MRAQPKLKKCAAFRVVSVPNFSAQMNGDQTGQALETAHCATHTDNPAPVGQSIPTKLGRWKVLSKIDPKMASPKKIPTLELDNAIELGHQNIIICKVLHSVGCHTNVRFFTQFPGSRDRGKNGDGWDFCPGLIELDIY